ncbi:DUF4199 domain-containing protein [Aureibaculum conchae]|uniref:DUF4199 domain-containing protein n=1 Tax=Aureibaculum sp. 2308TA14-22 TaxID=3108392 RepID=UPI0033983E69
MENQQKPTKNIALNYGLILGVASILLSVIIYAMGMAYKQDWKTGSISFIITIVVIILGIKKYKEANNGFLSLGQGLKTGVGIALIGAVIGIAYTLIFINVIEPDFMEKTLEISRQKMLENPNLSEDQIDQGLEMQRKFSSPAIIAAVGLVWSLFIGFVVSLIASLVMKRTEEMH